MYHIVSRTMISAAHTHIENPDSNKSPKPSNYAMSSSEDDEAFLDHPTSESSIDLDPARTCPHLRKKFRFKKK